MATFVGHLDERSQQREEQNWDELSAWLLPRVQSLVYNSGIIAWKGQHLEISEEITQEALLHIVDYNRRVNKGLCDPILSMRAFSMTTARHHFLDRCSKEKRIVHPDQISHHDLSLLSSSLFEHDDPAQIALDHLEMEEIFTSIAQAIVKFPQKRRRAIFIHLANLANLDATPEILVQVLAKEGVQLHEYSSPLPANREARSQHASLLHTAYRQLRKELRASLKENKES